MGLGSNLQFSCSMYCYFAARQTPFNVQVKFDEDEIASSAAASMIQLNEQQGAPGGIIGFGLIYTQGTTGCYDSSESSQSRTVISSYSLFIISGFWKDENIYQKDVFSGKIFTLYI